MNGVSFPPLFRIFRAFKYRDRMTIVGDILKSIRESKDGKKKTQIMQSANLNCIQFDKYMHYLLRCGFVSFTDKGKIDITVDGAKFLVSLEYRNVLARV
ncbi:MAG TPA: winged helix-turn-helix domain-containing protein [archaeon]|nr:winged helix-turn-helix domain-containing protein [archaeon]